MDVTEKCKEAYDLWQKMKDDCRNAEAMCRKMYNKANLPFPEGEELYLYCPTCQEEQRVLAEMDTLEFCNMHCIAFPDKHVELDWCRASTSGEFTYKCEECGTILARDLEELENKYKGQQNA